MTDADKTLRAVLAQADALVAGPNLRRRRFRALEVTCGRCGDLMVEVLRTSPWYVIRTRNTARPGPVPDLAVIRAEHRAATPMELGRAYARAMEGPAIRLGPWTTLVFDQDDPARYRDTRLSVACRCRSIAEYSMASLLNDLGDGVRQRTIPFD